MCCLHCVSALFQCSGYALILAIEDQIDDQASRKAANTDRICQQTGPKHQAAANAKNNAHNGIALALQKTDCTSAQTHNSDQRCKNRPCNMDRRSDQQDARIHCKNERSDKSAKRKAYAETERSITIIRDMQKKRFFNDLTPSLYSLIRHRCSFLDNYLKFFFIRSQKSLAGDDGLHFFMIPV